ncbi:hypothetical protein [Desulfobacula toluolica]|uniref:Conserved uncharacterized protein n=1 Tax=Desulfobacula toluolica (strain DSM 7467 / Tol2) TaxID=651182 RepID=K0NAF2_DESTT|nr:hypothetical protein [Desulfobacula toluolica]CCK81014.1 conserved uncharacterized protein [Desulfobacula toluolica Tol2]
MKTFTFLFFVLFALALPAVAAAHGTDYSLVMEEQVIAAKFFYSDKEPMRYSEVLIFSPENKEVEYQNGRTDQEGRFAFCPNKPGMWGIKVNDGMGHAVNTTITVNPLAVPGEKTPNVMQNKKNLFAESSMWLRIFFGLSLLLNIFWGLQTWKGHNK